ncbi:hypothetical protein JST97_29070, partial [bacterium]|nr:hypothetical protein [bacterium]
MAIGSVGSTPDFADYSMPEPAAAPAVEEAPLPAEQEPAPSMINISDSANVSSEASSLSSSNPEQGSFLDAMRENFGKASTMTTASENQPVQEPASKSSPWSFVRSASSDQSASESKETQDSRTESSRNESLRDNMMGLLAPSNRNSGPDTRLPGDQAGTATANSVDPLKSDGTTPPGGFPPALANLEALNRSIASQFNSLADRFQLSLGKLGDMRTSPLTPPPPGQSRASDSSQNLSATPSKLADAARESEKPSKDVLSAAGQFGKELFDGATDWLKQSLQLSNDNKLQANGLLDSIGNFSKSMLENANAWLKDTFSLGTDKKDGGVLDSIGSFSRSMLDGAGSWLKDTFKPGGEDKEAGALDSLVSFSNSMMDGASNWFKDTFKLTGDNKEAGIIGSISNFSKSALDGASNWLKDTFKLGGDSKEGGLLGSLGSFSKSMLDGASNWFKDTFSLSGENKDGGIIGSIGNFSKLALDSASSWMKSTFNLNGASQDSGVLEAIGSFSKNAFEGA